MPSKKQVEVRILIFKGRQKWVAQCLEYDIAVQAEDRDQLRAAFGRAVDAERVFCQMKGLEPFERLPSAPQRYFDRWDQLAAGESREPWKDFSAYLLSAQTATDSHAVA